MSAGLARLLGVNDKELARLIAKFEHLSGYNSEDVRLLANVRAQAAAKIASLGMDGLDTTAHELFHALQARLEDDNRHLVRALGLKAGDQAQTASRLVAAISQLERRPVLALKPAVIKDVLRHSPPRRLMRQLNYRSLESMLKRETPALLMSAAILAESGVWHRDAAKAFARLRRGDFEYRRVDFINLDRRWRLAGTASVTTAPLTGTVVAWPGQSSHLNSLKQAVMMIEAAELAETDSFYLETNQFRPDFGRLVVRLVLDHAYDPLELAGSRLFNWANLRQALDQTAGSARAMASISPALDWWVDAAKLLHGHDRPVSMHLADHAKAEADIDEHSNAHGQSALKSELLRRYMEHTGVKHYLHNQFDDKFMAMEPAIELEPQPVSKM